MKIISWNVRGLGGFEKKTKEMELVSEYKLFILCLPETKLSVLDEYLYSSLWGGMTQGLFFVRLSVLPEVYLLFGIVTK